jgi:transposase-like protein
MTREAMKKTRKAVGEDKDLLRELVREAVQQVLEAEMTEVVGVGKSERSAERRGYRSGYYERTLVTRVGKLDIRVPQDRDGRFSTEWTSPLGSGAGKPSTPSSATGQRRH